MMKEISLKDGQFTINFQDDFSAHFDAFPDFGPGDMTLEIETFNETIPGEKAVEVRAIVNWREVPE